MLSGYRCVILCLADTHTGYRTLKIEYLPLYNRTNQGSIVAREGVEPSTKGL